MKKTLAHHDRHAPNVIAALDELYDAERRANDAKDTYDRSPSTKRWRAFCEAAVEATSARSIAEGATGLRLRRVEGGRFCTVIEDGGRHA